MPGGGGGRRGDVPKHCRQFSCPVCEPARKRFDVRRWHKIVPDNHPYSTCTKCGVEYRACDIGNEFGVGVCKFECECDNKYTVVCRMIDLAECYQCYKKNSAVEFTPRRKIDKKTGNKHSCSRCDDGKKDCPNLSNRRRQR